jgi:RNA polymerase sigma factor (sigma-70 family)
LSTTLKNNIRTSLRKKLVREGALVDPNFEASLAPDPPDPNSFLTTTRQELDQAIGCLTARQLEVLELNQQGNPHADIAQKLDIKVGAVAKRLFDARKRLKAELQRIIAARKGGKP